MKDIPFKEAKQFCEDYEKDQCIILSWDETSDATWVTTYGVGDKNSKQAAQAGKILKDYLKLKRENEEIPTRFEEWEIESAERYYQSNGRNAWLYREITYWYEKHTKKRDETVREVSIFSGQEFKLPEWAKSITNRIYSSADDRVY